MRRLPLLVCVVLCFHLTDTLFADLPPLIPRQVLFGNPDKAYPTIAPDGKRLAYIAPHEGVMNVWVRTVGKDDDRVVTKDPRSGITEYFWAQNSRQIVYLQDKDGDENWHLHRVDLTSGEITDLTPFENVRAQVVAVDPDFPDEILVGLNNRDPQWHDVYRIQLGSGKAALEDKNTEGFIGWVADHKLHLRAAAKLTPRGGVALAVRDKAEAEWRTLLVWDPEDVINSDPLGFTPDSRGLYILSSAGSNTTELRQVELATSKETTLAADAQSDVSNVFVHPMTHAVQAVAFTKERSRWKVLDPAIEEDFRALDRIRRGDFKIINRDHADKTWLVSFTTDDGPVSYYVYDREAKKSQILFTNRKALEGVMLAKMEPIGFEARDGLKIQGYLTTPPGVPGKRLPTVLLVHSGPWARDTWGYNGIAQWLANRGYAVLQFNFRGSTGYGKQFLNAANREWAGRMHTDLVDGLEWAIHKGIVDRRRVAIFGGSYGGYATLVGLTMTPELFVCGVDICGPSNLITWMETIPPYWKPLEPIFFDRVGHPVKDAEFLKSRSPLTHIERITKPLLIGQGANDPRVKRSESLQIVEALKKAGKEVEYVEYPDEGHGFDRPENRLDFFARAEKFLAKHLGGRFEP